MDKSWMNLSNRLSKPYMEGVNSFLDVAKNHLNEEGKTRCPCRNCQNVIFKIIDGVEADLYKYGISQNYKRWVFHGEVVDFSEHLPTMHTELNNEMEGGDELLEMLQDLGGYNPTDSGQIDDHDGAVEVDHVPQRDVEKTFDELLHYVQQELYPGCTKFSSLNFLVKLMHIKVLNHWNNKSFDMLLQLLNEVLPDGKNIPTSYYEAKRVLRDLGLGYEVIHVCKYDCVLFWKEHADKDKCPTCDEPRYKNNVGKGRKIPQKVLRHFPLKPRLQRLFMSKHTALDMRWHKEKRVSMEGILRHPADAEAWKDFDKNYDWFAQDPRNVRLALASDGFNPFGNMNNAYSMWPVMLIPYNLPPWKCMKEPFTMMSLLIPGKQSPGKDIDVYLQPLVDELKELWNVGVKTFDVSSGQNFQLHAAVLWTINDFPAYGDLSGWSTKGYMACPVCNEDTTSRGLRNKICYMGHRRFLPMNHPWRKSRKHDGDVEYREAPKMRKGDDIVQQLQYVRNFKFGKHSSNLDRKRKRTANELNWTKKSIFFQLPYWSTLKIRHKLDVMHIEKNICDNILGTLLNIEGKTKDTEKARLDLADMNIRQELHLQLRDNGSYTKPHACYTLTPTERKDFCKFLKSVKFPDSFASNISRCVNINEVKISGLKSHDCHVILQRLIPVGIRAYLRKDICTTLIEFSNFFREICAKTLNVQNLEKLEEGIVLILCKLEKIFPPAFFDVMVHLAVHLPYEAKLVGPVGYSWMYPIERNLGKLKRFVKNKARPEGSIAEGYIVSELLTFCSMYLHGVETKFNRDERNDDGSHSSQHAEQMSVFSRKVRPFGAINFRQYSQQDIDTAHWYVLNNCEELRPYRDKHLAQLRQESNVNLTGRHQKQFAKWFSQHMKSLRHDGSPEVTNELYALACGPDARVQSYPGCIVNGVRYNIEERDRRHITQNCGLVVEGDHDNAIIDFYGILKDVIQLNYMFNYRAILFQCVWFDTNVKKKRIQKDYNYTCIDVSHKWYENDPYILAVQAQQVFYLNDHKYGSTWKVVQKIQHRHIWDVPEMEEEIAEQEENVEILDVEEEDLDDHQFDRQDTEAETLDSSVVLSNQTTRSNDPIDDVDEDETLINYNSDDEEIAQDDDDSDIDA